MCVLVGVRACVRACVRVTVDERGGGVYCEFVCVRECVSVLSVCLFHILFLSPSLFLFLLLSLTLSFSPYFSLPLCLSARIRVKGAESHEPNSFLKSAT